MDLKNQIQKRELKFRAWDGAKMHYNIVPWQWDFVIDLGWHRCEKSTGNGILGSGGKAGEFLVPGIAFKEIMQFTGLKDKNGKEIYEGDVIKFVGGTANFIPCGIYSYQKHEVGTILVVTKLLSGFSLQKPLHINEDIPNLVGNIDNYTFWNHQRSFEVIGNIYDNPELL